MSQEIREQLSALMDGELSRDETGFLLRRMGHDQALVACWSGFHLVRQALRRQEIVGMRGDFAAGVMASIETEAQPGQKRSGSLLRWASGGAIAASVAVAALVLSGPRDVADSLPGESMASTATTPAPVLAATAAATPVVARNPEFRPPMISPVLDVQPASASSAGFSTPSTPLDPRTQSYLVRHYDATGINGQPGMLPYVLLIVPATSQTAVAPRKQVANQQR